MANTHWLSVSIYLVIISSISSSDSGIQKNSQKWHQIEEKGEITIHLAWTAEYEQFTLVNWIKGSARNFQLINCNRKLKKSGMYNGRNVPTKTTKMKTRFRIIQRLISRYTIFSATNWITSLEMPAFIFSNQSKNRIRLTNQWIYKMTLFWKPTRKKYMSPPKSVVGCFVSTELNFEWILTNYISP